MQSKLAVWPTEDKERKSDRLLRLIADRVWLSAAAGITLASSHRHQEFLPFLRKIDRAIRRGSFGSVKQLIKRIDQFVFHYNENCKPFMWTASADSILEKLHRLCSRISGTEH